MRRLLAATLAATAALAVLLLAGCGTAGGSSTGTADTITPTTTPTSSTLSVEDQVDQAIAADGTPFIYDTSAYPDAYSAVMADCHAWSSSPTDVTALLRGRLAAGYIQAGEVAALKVGVPLACPEYALQVTAALG